MATHVGSISHAQDELQSLNPRQALEMDTHIDIRVDLCALETHFSSNHVMLRASFGVIALLQKV